MATVKVRYKGASDVRILPADQLTERGVKNVDKDLVFKPENLWSMEIEMTDELEAILRADGAFVIQPLDDSGSTTTTDAADPLQTSVEGVDDTGNTVVDGDTGQTEENKQPLASETGTTAGPDTNVATGRV